MSNAAVMGSSTAVLLMLAAAVTAATEGLAIVRTSPCRFLHPLQLHSRYIGSAARISPRKLGSSRTCARTTTATPVMSAPFSTATNPSPVPSSSGKDSGFALEGLPFDNAALRELPIDPEPENFVRKVPNACFSIVAPDAVENPVLVAASTAALKLLGVGPEQAEREDFAEYFSGDAHFLPDANLVCWNVEVTLCACLCCDSVPTVVTYSNARRLYSQLRLSQFPISCIVLEELRGLRYSEPTNSLSSIERPP